jgi:hypothetical protein
MNVNMNSWIFEGGVDTGKILKQPPLGRGMTDESGSEK